MRSMDALDRLAMRCAQEYLARQPRADFTIAQLPLGGTAVAGDLVPIYRAGQTYQVTAASLSATSTTAASGFVNVQTFGAKGDGVTDDTISIQKAVNALPTYGTLFFPSGTYLLSLQGVIGGYNYCVQSPTPINIMGAGAGTTILRFSNGQLLAGTPLGSGTSIFLTTAVASGLVGEFRLSNITCDGNGSNQNFTPFTSTSARFYFFGNTGLGAGYPLLTARFEGVNAINLTTLSTGTAAVGILFQQFGFQKAFYDNCLFDNFDLGIYYTEYALTTPGMAVVTNCIFHNCYNKALTDEGFSNFTVTNCLFVNDSLPPIGGYGQVSNPIGIAVFVNQNIKNIAISNCTFVNQGWPIYVGLLGGGFSISDSIFSNCTAVNCRGSFLFGYLSPTCYLSNIYGDNMAQGITGQLIYGGIEFNAPTGSINANNIGCVNNATQPGIHTYGPLNIRGGNLANNIAGGNGNWPISYDTAAHQQASDVQGVVGYNPIVSGVNNVGAAPAVPASAVTYVNQYGAPIWVYVGGGTVSVINIVPAGLAARGTGQTAGSFYLPPGWGIQITYTVAPNFSTFGA
ncbi:MAG: hypothetical protein NVS1B2_15790 [Vulcanimicrobiaceae bacterium]